MHVRTSPVVMATAGDPGDIHARQCGTCDGASASCWCVDCSEALCDACLAAHRRVTLTRSHRVLNRQPEGPSLVFPTKFCRIHPSEELKLFCFSCCQLTCRDCQLADHQNHRFDFVSKAVASVKKQLDACMQPFRAQMDASRRSLQDMETRLQVLARCESFMTSKLQKHVDTLMEMLKKRFEEIIKQIQVVYNVERNLISRKMEKVKQLQQSHVPLTEAAEKARSTTNLPTLVGCISQITSQMKDLVDEDSRPPSKMIDVKVITDRNSVEGILNFGKLQVSWIPFSTRQVEPPPSSSSLLPAPPTSTCRPLTCSTATTNSSSVAAPPAGSTSTFIRTGLVSGSGTAASSAPPVRISCSTPPPYSSSSYSSSSVDAMTDFIENNKAVLHPKSSSISKLDPSCGSWGPSAQIPRVPSSNNSLPVPGSTSLPVPASTSFLVPASTSFLVPASTSLPVPASTSLPVPASTSLPVPAVVKSRAAQDIEARNPFLWSLLSQSSPSSSSLSSSSPSSSSPASPSLPSSGLVRGQSSSSCSSSSLTSDVRLQTSTTKGPGRVADRSEGAKPTPSPEPSRGFDSAVRINVLTKSQLESSSDKLFVKFQWMKKNSKSSKSSSSLVPSSPKIKRLLSGKRQPQRIQNQPGSPVRKLNRQASGMESLPSMPSVPPFPSTDLVFSKAVSTAAPPGNIQPLVQLSPSLNQQVLGQNLPPSILLLTNTSQNPVTGSGSGPPSSVSAGPQTLPGNDPSVRWSPEIQNLPESNNLQLLECLISEVGLPSSALKDQQQNPASKQTGKRKEPNRLVQGSSAGIDPPLGCRSSDPTRTGASDQDLIVVLSDDESLPDVYEVQPSVEEVRSFLPPVTVGGSDVEINIVETKPPGFESKPRTLKFIERDIFDEPASPAVSEDRMSTALSEVPELGLKLSSSETSDSDDEDLLSIRTEQLDYGQLCWQPTVSLLRLPLSLPGPGRPLPRYHFILGDKQDELYLQEMEEDDQSSDEDVSEIVTDHDSDVTEDFTILQSTESPLSLEVISCAACGSSSASKICTVCGRGYHRDCHVPPFGPDIWSELVCSLCQDLSDPSDPYSSDRPKSPHGSSLSLQDQRRCETLLLHLKVEGCRHFSQLDLWSDLMLVSERLSHHRSPPYQTPGQVVSDLWDLFSDASQGNALMELQQSFQKRLVETLGSELPSSLRIAPSHGSAPPRGSSPHGSYPRQANAPLDSGENLLSNSKVKVLKKRLKDLLNLQGPATAKRPKSVDPKDQTDQM
ncbi:E3 ubiquitin-protein ligase TRIM33 isoform X1 [Poecilia formosa]|uniref:E3 ubiquitin-protein ligase TRIM33 isoform X1 n=2 Tax=Poecilia formosa TaxID=48698 RepID=UPI0007BA9790|nr:PREDICTED: E3 ubiquitin-protein ligase TRIM33-like isoform X1 [Poecilia formosa]